MKNKFLAICFSSLGIFPKAQYDGNVGINTTTPKAALDIKSATNDGSRVLRFSTQPKQLDKSKEYVIFAGQKVDDGYNLRKIGIDELFNVIGVFVPSTKRIVVVNSSKETIPQKKDYTIKMDKKVFSSSNDDYQVYPTSGEVEIKKEGYYDITSWVGFEKIGNYVEGDILIRLQKKEKNNRDFKDFKASVISRSNTENIYSVGNGIGGSFAFVDKFKEGDRLRISVKNYNFNNLNTLSGSVSLTISRADKEYINILTP